MADASAAILLYVVGLPEAAAQRIDSALEAALSAPNAAILQVATALPSDEAARTEARARGADTVVEIESDGGVQRVRLRVSTASSGWQERTLALASSSEQDARERAVGSVAAEMIAPAAAPATPSPRFEYGGAFALALGEPVTPGFATRFRVRLVQNAWVHLGASVRGGTAPVDGGVREIPLEAGLGYHLPLGDRLQIGLRAEAILLSRRMSVANAGPQHRWLFAVRGGAEVHLRMFDQFGFALLLGAEAHFGRTEVEIPGTGSGAFSPVRPYGELGPYVTF